MENSDYEADDSLKAILSELSTVSTSIKFKPEEEEIKEDELSSENLESFILKNGAKAVSTTQRVINVLLEQIKETPNDAELITSVAEMVGSNNKALVTLAKLHLNNEKLKQAKELEIFRQSTRLQIAEQSEKASNPQVSREDIMKVLYDVDKDSRYSNQPVKPKEISI